MILCRVVGDSVSAVQHPCYIGRTVLVMQRVEVDGRTPLGDELLAVDSVQAGVGGLVLAAREGNSARQILGNDEDPLHAVEPGIVDQVDASPRRGRGPRQSTSPPDQRAPAAA